MCMLSRSIYLFGPKARESPMTATGSHKFIRRHSELVASGRVVALSLHLWVVLSIPESHLRKIKREPVAETNHCY